MTDSANSNDNHFEENPFHPGQGVAPHTFAGRDKEQSELRRLLRRLNSGRGTDGDIIVYGPRGNGKTVLLGWLGAHIVSRDILSDAQVISIATAVVKNLDDFESAIAGDPTFLNKLSRTVSFGVSIAGIKLDVRQIKRSGSLGKV